MGGVDGWDEDVEEVGKCEAAGMVEMVAVEETCSDEIRELCEHKRRVGGGVLLCFSIILRKCTHTVRVGIEGVCPLHIDHAQPHDGPIPNVLLHIRNCNKLPESSSIKTTINYLQTTKWM